MAQDKREVINPGGTVQVETVNGKPHPESLDGKTVLLKWNGKHNGDLFLNRVGELLTEDFKDVKIVKAWKAFPETGVISSHGDKSREFAKKLSGLKPDISIGANGD